MLKERIISNQEVPTFIEFSNIQNEYYHFHSEVEIILVLRGSLKCKIRHKNYELSTGELLIINADDLHRLNSGSQDILLLRLYINLSRFINIHSDIESMIFTSENYRISTEYEQNISKLKSMLINIMSLHIQKQRQNIINNSMKDLIKLLMCHFRGFYIYSDDMYLNDRRITHTDLDRIERIMEYIGDNREHKITLKEIADNECLSPYYLSHMIKKNFGLNFQDLLNYLRLEQAEKLIVIGNMTLTQISEFCGFSTTAYMNKCFQRYYKITPKEYKNTIRVEERSYGKMFTQDEAVILLESFSRKYQKSFEFYIKNDPLVASGKDFFIHIHFIINSFKDLLILFHKINLINVLRIESIVLNWAEVESDVKINYIFDICKSLLERGFNLRAVKPYNDTTNSFLSVYNSLAIPIIIPKTDKDLTVDNNSFQEVFIKVLEGRDVYVPVSNCENALFYHRMLTPVYFLLYELSKTRGKIINQTDNCIIIASEAKYILFIANSEIDFSRQYSINFANLSGFAIMTSKTIQNDIEKNRIAKKLDKFYKSSDDIIDDLNTAVRELSQIQEYHAEGNLCLPVIVPPQTLSILKLAQFNN